MVKLRTFEKNLPDECRNNLLVCRAQTIPEIIEGLSSPSEDALIVWLPAIHRFLDIYKLSNDELRRLISLLYSKIFNSDISLDGLCVTLRLLNRCLSLKSDLTLTVNWRDFYDFYQELLKTSTSFLISKKQISGVFEEISKCIKRSRKYFSAEASQEIFQFFGPKLCPGGKNTEVIMWICNLMPNKGQGSCEWIEPVLNLLFIDHRNLNWMINVLSFLGTAAKKYPQFDWNPILPRLYNEVLPSLPLLSKSLPRPKTFFFEPQPTSNLNAQYMKKSSAFAKIVAYSLDNQNIQLLEQWLRNMQGTIKEGKLIGSGYINYISRIVAAFCKRIQLSSEKKLPVPDPSLRIKLSMLVLPLIRLICYSGQITQIDRVCSQLCFLAPEQVIPELINYSIELLQDYEIPHQGVIQLLTGILRPILEPTIYSLPKDTLHLILNLTLSELSASDMQKSCKILSIYGQISCYFQLNYEIFAGEFFTTLLNTLAELEVSNRDSAEQTRGLKIEECIELNMNVIVDNISQSIYDSWVEEFLEYVARNNKINAVVEFATIGKFLARRNPKQVLNKLVKLCQGLLGSAKNQILWRVGLLTEAFLYAGQGACEFDQLVFKIVEDLREEFPEESGKLLASVIEGCLDVYPLEFSCILPKNLGQCVQSGRFLNQSKELDLGINWNLPSEHGISIVNEILNKYLLQVPETKQELKTFFKFANVLVQSWATYIKIPTSPPGVVKFPVLSTYEKLINFEQSIKGIIDKIQGLSFLNEDPLLLEGFVEFLSNSVHYSGLTFAYVRMASKLVNELRRNNFNPLVALKEKNLNQTRPYLIQKTHNLYKKLISSNYCQKTFEGTYSDLFAVLVNYAQSHFKQVRAKAINSIKNILKCSFTKLKGIIKLTWESVIQNLDLNDSEKLKPQLEILVDHEAIWRKNIIGDNLCIFEILSKTQQFSDIELQTQIFNFFSNFVMSFYPSCRLVNKKFTICENSLVTEKILFLIKSNLILHWRSQLYLLILILTYKNSFKIDHFPVLSQYLTNLVIDENFDIRETAQRVLGSYLWLYTKSNLERSVIQFTPTMFNDHSRYLDQSHISQSMPVYVGWTNTKFEITVKKGQNTEKKDEISEFFMNKEKIGKFFEFLAVGHMLKSEESIVNNPRTRMNDNVNSSIRFLNNPHKFLEAFYMRPFGSSPDFSIKTANLVQYFGELYGESQCQVLFETCEKYILREKPYQAAALEILAGLGKASRTWASSDRFLQSLNFAFRNSQINSVNTWKNMLIISLKKLSLSVQLKIFNNLLELMSLFSNKKLSKILKLLSNVISIISWKGSSAFCQFFEVLKNLPHDIFADLRISVSKVISKIVVYTSWVEINSENQPLHTFAINEKYSLSYHQSVFEYLDFLSSSDTSYSNQLLLEIIQQLYLEVNLEFSLFPLFIHSLPCLLSLLRHPDIKIVTKSSDVLKLLAPVRTTSTLYSQIHKQISSCSVSDSKVQEMIKGLVLTMMWYYNQYLLTPPTAYFFEVVNKGNIEVKQAGKYYLSMIWRIASEQEKQEEFERILNEPQGQGTCFRLSALVLAQKEFIEPWKGQALVKLGKMKKNGGETSLCVNSTLAEFWKFHKAWWTSFMKYSKCFSAEELEEIESFNSDHTYFS